MRSTNGDASSDTPASSSSRYTKLKEYVSEYHESVQGSGPAYLFELSSSDEPLRKFEVF